MVLPPSRSGREALARELRARGLRLREIAAEFGVAISTVDSWLNDPGGERLRKRKDSYRGRCERCGAPTDGSSGRASAPRLCIECFRTQPHSLERAQRLRGGAPQRYSDQQLLEELRRADTLALRTATTYSSHAGAHQLPSLATLIHRFGTWNEARRRAGLATRPSPRKSYGRTAAEECARAVAGVWASIGQPPTVQRYERGRRASNPCAATVRARCGSWADALALASEFVEPYELPAAA
jgi:transcriptional regulator with XRE-family HTH domain